MFFCLLHTDLPQLEPKYSVPGIYVGHLVLADTWLANWNNRTPGGLISSS